MPGPPAPPIISLGPIYTPVSSPIAFCSVTCSRFPTKIFGVIRYVLPIVVLLFSQSLIQSNIVASRMTEYWNITVATNSSSVPTSTVTVPDRASTGISVRVSRFVKSVPVTSYLIPVWLGVIKLIMNGTLTSPLTTVISQ